MGTLFTILAFAFFVLAFVCWVIIVIDAFQNEIWKGVVYILCGFYALYYALVEFDHEKKWLIVAGVILGNIAGYVFLFMGGIDAGA